MNFYCNEICTLEIINELKIWKDVVRTIKAFNSDSDNLGKLILVLMLILYYKFKYLVMRENSNQK